MIRHTLRAAALIAACALAFVAMTLLWVVVSGVATIAGWLR